MDVNQPLIENSFYHIYNRGNNGDNIFYKRGNYDYFLKSYDKHLSDFVETYAYCLLPNHFHLLIRIKPFLSFPRQSEQPELIVSEQFRKFFIGYSQAINKQESRSGSLFQKPFKRKEVDREAYFSHLIYYIHANPQKHGICNDFKQYEYSSYGRILIEKPSKLFKNEVIEWFGSKQHYIDFHHQSMLNQENEDWVIEDL
ncbi:MAG: transposase [Bacteroidetes bacterium]|nr:transposase [Bacteroidota bacterium]